MIKKEVIDYIESAHSRGFSRAEIAKKLLSAGHSKSVVDEHLRVFSDRMAARRRGFLSAMIILAVATVLFLLLPVPDSQVSDVDLVVVSNVSVNSSLFEPKVVVDRRTLVRDVDVYCADFDDLVACQTVVELENTFSNYRSAKIAISKAFVSGDVGVCDSLLEPERSVCLEVSKIPSLSDIGSCNLLSGAYVQSLCQTKFYFELSKSDSSYCDKIRIPLGARDACLEALK